MWSRYSCAFVGDPGSVDVDNCVVIVWSKYSCAFVGDPGNVNVENCVVIVLSLCGAGIVVHLLETQAMSMLITVLSYVV